MLENGWRNLAISALIGAALLAVNWSLDNAEQQRRARSAYWQGMLEGYVLGLQMDESDDHEREAMENFLAGNFAKQ